MITQAPAPAPSPAPSVAPRLRSQGPTGRPLMTTADRPSRLTRRGRLVVTLLTLLAAVGLFVLSGPASVAGGSESGPALVEVVVEPGQTLWELASTAVPGADPREVIQRVRELNALAPTDAIVPGQALLVPAA